MPPPPAAPKVDSAGESPPRASPPPLRRGSGAVLEPPLLDPLLLDREAREALDRHVRRKRLQLLWGLPALVRSSLETSEPALPGFLVCTALQGAPGTHRPLFKAERRQSLERHLREKLVHRNWGLPKSVEKALRRAASPATVPAEGGRRGAETLLATGLPQKGEPEATRRRPPAAATSSRSSPSSRSDGPPSTAGGAAGGSARQSPRGRQAERTNSPSPGRRHLGSDARSPGRRRRPEKDGGPEAPRRRICAVAACQAGRSHGSPGEPSQLPAGPPAATKGPRGPSERPPGRPLRHPEAAYEGGGMGRAYGGPGPPPCALHREEAERSPRPGCPHPRAPASPSSLPAFLPAGPSQLPLSRWGADPGGEGPDASLSGEDQRRYFEFHLREKLLHQRWGPPRRVRESLARSATVQIPRK